MQQASVVWLGTHKRGKGAVITLSPALRNTPYTSGSPFKGKFTSPPELIAAAHAGSFSLALASEPGIAGDNPSQIDPIATEVMKDVVEGWTMAQVQLNVAATVPRATQCDSTPLCGPKRLSDLAIGQRQHFAAGKVDEAPEEITRKL